MRVSFALVPTEVYFNGPQTYGSTESIARELATGESTLSSVKLKDEAGPSTDVVSDY